MKAIIFGASGGIGRALSHELEARGASVTQLSRKEHGFDVTDETSVALASSRIEGPVSLMIDATGILEVDGVPPERSFRAIDPNVMARAYAVNAIGSALLFKHFVKHLPRNERAVFASLSARVGSIGDNRLGGWMSYRASKAALNQIIRCASIEIQRTRREAIIVALHPGTVETDLTRAYARGRYTQSASDAASEMLDTLGELTPNESGNFFAYDGSIIEW